MCAPLLPYSSIVKIFKIVAMEHIVISEPYKSVNIIWFILRKGLVVALYSIHNIQKAIIHDQRRQCYNKL